MQGTRTLALLAAIAAAALAPASAVAQTKAERLAFASQRDGNFEIYIAEGDGSLPTRLTNHPALDVLPSMPAIATKIAFASLRDGNSELYVMDADGSNVQRLTNDPRIDTFETFSPDGSKIAFATNRDAPPGNGDVKYSEVYVMNADGSAQTRLTNNEVFDGFPSWTPDSSRIVFTSLRDGKGEIYTMNADGTLPTRVTNNDLDEVLPSMSPDGRRIAFSHYDGDSEIYVINADGTGARQLTNDFSVSLPDPIPSPAPFDETPTWTPDSARIVFGSNRGGDSEIFSMSAADGSDMRNLTRRAGVDVEPSVARVPAPGQPGAAPLPGTGRARPRGVSVTGSARCTARRRTRRCRVRLRGSVQRPSGSSASCRGGRVALAVRLGRRTVLSARVPVNSRCGYSLNRRFRFRTSRRVRAFRVTPRFTGNGFLAPARGTSRRVRAR